LAAVSAAVPGVASVETLPEMSKKCSSTRSRSGKSAARVDPVTAADRIQSHRM
jgi:hypothetical protein